MASFPGFDSPAYGQIGGNLPWGQGQGSGAGAFGATSPYQVAGAYQQAYNSSLAQNESMYTNIMAGYQKSLASQTTAQQAIQAGYSDLYNNVLGQVKNMYAGQSEGIDRASAQAGAKDSQQLIDRGLGNTTVQSSVNRGVESDRQYQQTLLTGQEAGTQAQYMSQLGMAGLQSQQHGVDAATGLQGRQLDFMNSMKAGYPDGGMYAGLAQQAAMNQANRRNPMTFGGGQQGGAGPKLGYVPGGGPYYGSGSYGGPPSTGGGSWMMDQYTNPTSPATPQDSGYGATGYNVANQVQDAGVGAYNGMWGDYGGGGDF